MDPSKIKNYTIYYGINTSRKISDYSEVLSIKGITNIKRLYDYYVQNRSSITCYDLGYFIFSDLKFHYDLIETGRISALRHASKDDRYFDENLNTIKAIIEFAEKKGIKVFFYTVPAYRTFVENLDSMQLKRTINTLNDLEKKYNNVVYRNYLEDKSYSEDDFFDADHLNEMGATKFTLKIDSLINLNSELTWSKLHLSTKLREI